MPRLTSGCRQSLFACQAAGVLQIETADLLITLVGEAGNPDYLSTLAEVDLTYHAQRKRVPTNGVSTPFLNWLWD